MTFSPLSLSAFRACKSGHIGFTMRINGIPTAVADNADALDAICNEWQAVTGTNCGSIELVAPNGRVYAD